MTRQRRRQTSYKPQIRGDLDEALRRARELIRWWSRRERETGRVHSGTTDIEYLEQAIERYDQERDRLAVAMTSVQHIAYRSEDRDERRMICRLGHVVENRIPVGQTEYVDPSDTWQPSRDLRALRPHSS